MTTYLQAEIQRVERSLKSRRAEKSDRRMRQRWVGFNRIIVLPLVAKLVQFTPIS